MGVVMGWYQSSSMPFPEPMLAMLTDAYMRHQYSESQGGWVPDSMDGLVQERLTPGL